MANLSLDKEVKHIPNKPGVYLFKNIRGSILYVGKAKALNKRVRSYFNKNQAQPKVMQIIAQSDLIDYYVTSTEVEALVLEANLIKQYRPKYNVSYRDDKTYPYLVICLDEEWPRVRYTREKHRDKRRYFGPYTNARALKETLDTLLKIFPLRTCSSTVFARAANMNQPCLYFHINRCPGPCVGRADVNEYGRTLELISAFLEGRQEQVIADLSREMSAASDKLEFERALFFRDRLRTATQITEKQRVTSDNRLNQDVFGLALEPDIGCIQWLKIRAGKLIGSEDFIINQAGGMGEVEGLTGFIKQFYDDMSVFPDEIVVPAQLEESGAIADWLSEKRGRKVKITLPNRGLKRRLADMAVENAEHSLTRYKLRFDYESKRLKTALTELRKSLKLKSDPAVIECYDISNISGTNAVGSMIVFLNGQPARSSYRRFKIRFRDGRPNDVGMIKEVLGRRLRRAVDDPKFATTPDLIIVDGGKPQLGAALAAIKEAGEEGLAVAALAKKNEELFVPDRPGAIVLPKDSQGLYLVKRIRDEAHRFALAYHRQIRSKTMKHSSLDDVPGIGPKRRQLLVKKFGSLKKIKAASESELVAAGLPRDLAKRFKATF
ncbi:MAG TPA: excinuclease ABC subunit UvrC [Actinobacteria bacterium]|nr:excinuclease ABC subunit UvrC [Actinomycetota bacterium]